MHHLVFFRVFFFFLPRKRQRTRKIKGRERESEGVVFSARVLRRREANNSGIHPPKRTITPSCCEQACSIFSARKFKPCGENKRSVCGMDDPTDDDRKITRAQAARHQKGRERERERRQRKEGGEHGTRLGSPSGRSTALSTTPGISCAGIRKQTPCFLTGCLPPPLLCSW